jgi:hypothetical protein
MVDTVNDTQYLSIWRKIKKKKRFVFIFKIMDL